MDRILEFLKGNSPFYFATVEGDKPRVRPFGFCMEFRGRLYFGMGRHKASYRQLQSNPNVEVSTTNDKGEWIRIKGVAVFDDSEEADRAAFEAMPTLRRIYNEETGFKLGLVYLKDGEAEIDEYMGGFDKFTF
jgi:uncharacterized pyridoxamine 5'-phosphate oxidase family protein